MSRQIKALVIYPTGTAESGIQTFSPSLAALQKRIGGTIEGVYGYRAADGTMSNWPRCTFYCADEGKYQHLSINLRATALWWHLDPQAAARDVLVGPVVVVGISDDGDGEDASVPDHVFRAYSALVDGEDPAYAAVAAH